MHNVSHEQQQQAENELTCKCEDGHYPVKNDDLITNRYHVVCRTGLGNSSTVWQCWDLVENRFVAVKIMKTDFTEIAEHEITLLKRARHFDTDNPQGEKVVKLLNDFEVYGENCVHVCLVFEAMGEDVLALSLKCPDFLIPLPMVKSIIKQVLQGLDYLHAECKIAHMDIKPENILICKDEKALFESAAEIGFIPDVSGNQEQEILVKELEELSIQQQSDSASSSVSSEFKLGSDISVKIADLGNAFYEEPYFDEHVQTVPYRSPEVILGASYDTSADIWSVACMAFELATGTYLFETVDSAFCSEDADHLSKMIDLLGKIPKNIALAGKFSNDYFNEDGDQLNIQIEPYEMFKVLTEKYKFAENEAALFKDFLLPMLEYDISKRATAQDCIKHAWLEN